MKIFISWSGKKSEEVAKVLKKWIPCVIQSAEPYFSSADIDKGSRWSSAIAKELESSSFGILVVTKDNLTSPWLNFEAGALSKTIAEAKVCPLLVDLKPIDVPKDSPILQFQMATSTKKDIFKIFESINSNLGDVKIDTEVLNTTFESFWGKMEEGFKSIDDSILSANIEPTPTDQIIELLRYQQNILRNPDNLLPREYIIDILNSAEFKSSRPSNNYISRTQMKLVKHAQFELDNILHDIDLAMSKSEELDSVAIANNIKKILKFLQEVTYISSNNELNTVRLTY